jgi:hypothetical protein
MFDLFSRIEEDFSLLDRRAIFAFSTQLSG